MSASDLDIRTALTARNSGLDGLRGLAVITVLLFHLRFDGASSGFLSGALPTGGFLGVSLFFTLSGYLITQIVLDENRRTGTISLRAFWVRRLRRLMPGALVALFLIVLAALVSDVFRSSSIRSDLWSALGYGANWQFMTAQSTYADLFVATPSPVLHFWSLAIEEQFYLFFPIVLVVLLSARRWVLPVGLSCVWIASLTGSFLGSSDNTVYYGTHTRAAELLTGALLALIAPIAALSSRHEKKDARGRSRVMGTALSWALVVFIVLVYSVEISDRWLYRGGFAAVSFVSALLVIGVQVRGPLQWLAERPALVVTGRLSYGLYLFHWPIFLLLDESRTGLGGWLLQGVRLGVTVFVAVIVFRLIENPIRYRRRLVQRGRSALTFIGAVVLVAVGIGFISQTDRAALAGLDAPDSVVDFGEMDDESRLRVAVLGSQPAALTDVRRSLGNLVSLEIESFVNVECPTFGSDYLVSNCSSIVQRLMAIEKTGAYDLLIIGFGGSERRLLNSERERTGGDVFQPAIRFAGDIRENLRGREVLLLDYGIRDPLFGELENLGLESTEITTFQRPSDSVLRDALSVIIEKIEGEDHRQRVMVIGDSSSFGVSAAIDATAGDRFDVLWAGRRNCPLVEVQRLRWWEGVEFDMEPCPTLNPEWRSLIKSFSPRVIVIVVAIPEQAEQMYLGDSTWHVVGDGAFTAAHDAFMAEFMTVLEERDIELMIFSSPRIHGGALGGAPFSHDDRVAAWNVEISKWITTWPQITLVDWAGILERAESPAGSLRSDGVHLEQSDLNRIIGAEILAILETTSRSLES